MSHDRFRRQYRELNPAQIESVDDVKVAAENLEDIIENLANTREKSLALTALEECVMWATKAIT